MTTEKHLTTDCLKVSFVLYISAENRMSLVMHLLSADKITFHVRFLAENREDGWNVIVWFVPDAVARQQLLHDRNLHDSRHLLSHRYTTNFRFCFCTNVFKN